MTEEHTVSEMQQVPPAPPAVPGDLGRAELMKLKQLMKRDELDWPTFLRRAVQAYDLMYSRSE